jgi:hypothetical protein
MPGTLRLAPNSNNKGNTVNRFILAAAFIAGSAQASTIQFVVPSQGQAFAVLGVSCGGIKIDTYVTGFENGSVAGEVHLTTKCSSGGRGSQPRTYQAWASISWDLNGQIMNFPLPYDSISPDPDFTEVLGSYKISTTLGTSGYRAVLTKP